MGNFETGVLQVMGPCNLIDGAPPSQFFSYNNCGSIEDACTNNEETAHESIHY